MIIWNPLSMTPEPMNHPFPRYSSYFMRPMLDR